jgi:heme/copper-type cytochrome/quinol oxidase subunit 2
MTPHRRNTAFVFGCLTLVTAVWSQSSAREQTREITISGDQYTFSPARIEVQKDELVKITFSARDIAHSFTIDHPYRIAKRANAGQSVTLEFRADQAGTFPFYCNLTQDERCRQMKGELVVK